MSGCIYTGAIVHVEEHGALMRCDIHLVGEMLVCNGTTLIYEPGHAATHAVEQMSDYYFHPTKYILVIAAKDIIVEANATELYSRGWPMHIPIRWREIKL